MRQEIVTAMIPSHNLGEIRSLKANRAINAVAAISKLLSNDAFAAVVMDKPSNRQIGAAISRTIMAIVKGSSAFVRFVSYGTKWENCSADKIRKNVL